MPRSPHITTAVILAAGKGTRVMPLTFHQPKAMIGIVDRPIIQYVVDEIIAAGITTIVIVHSPGQKAIRAYIEHMQQGAWRALAFHFVLQPRAIGNADAVYRARKFIGSSPFILAFGDDINYPSPIKALMACAQKADSPAFFLEKVPWDAVHRYGVVAAKKAKGSGFFTIERLVEKPARAEAPSNLSIIGRYVLTPEILVEIKKLYGRKQKGELLLTDAFASYLARGGTIRGMLNAGTRFDCGSKAGILKAQVFFGKRHPELGKEFKTYLAR